jgi:hypothetical protein
LRAGDQQIRQPKPNMRLEFFKANRGTGIKFIFYRNPNLKMDLEIVLPWEKQIIIRKKIFSHNTPPVLSE